MDIFGEQHRLERMLKERDAEIDRLRAVLHGVIEATDLDEVSVIARRGLEQK